jgi:hypothetical protein
MRYHGAIRRMLTVVVYIYPISSFRAKSDDEAARLLEAVKDPETEADAFRTGIVPDVTLIQPS